MCVRELVECYGCVCVVCVQCMCVRARALARACVRGRVRVIDPRGDGQIEGQWGGRDARWVAV